MSFGWVTLACPGCGDTIVFTSPTAAEYPCPCGAMVSPGGGPRCSTCGAGGAISYGPVAFCERCVREARWPPTAAEIPDSPVSPDRTASPPERLTGKIIGFRGWTLDGYRLKSANAKQHGGYWKIGPNRAECLISKRIEFLGGFDPRRAPTPPHDAPYPGCECGLYAYFDVRRENNPHNFGPDLLWGAVTAWGRIEVHAQGFRAEYAEPVVLAYDPRQAYEDVIRAQTMAAEFGLPFVTLDELPAEAARYGQVVPEDMRPAGLLAFDAMLQSFLSSPHFASGGIVPTFESAMWLASGNAANALGALGHAGYAAKIGPSKPVRAPKTPRRPVTNIRQRLKTVGPPYHGKYREGDLVADRKGHQWVCVKGGKPGSWTAYEPET